MNPFNYYIISIEKGPYLDLKGLKERFEVHDVVLSLDATVMMICHRLQHIKRFQQVVVLDQGVLVEEGAPSQLLDRKPPSQLAKLCAAAGL